MSAIPYYVGNRISQTIVFPFQFYRMVQNVLLGMDGLGVYLGIPSWAQVDKVTLRNLMPTYQAGYFILRHIALRTLPFWKLFEFVRIEEISYGIPTIGIAPSCLSPRTVVTGLSKLSRTGIILRIELPRSQAVTKLYGLDIYRIMKLVEKQWRRMIRDTSDSMSGNARSVASRKAQKFVDVLLEYMEAYEPVFDLLRAQTNQPIIDLDDFLEKLKKALPDNRQFRNERLIDDERNTKVRKKELVLDRANIDLNGE
ncbi:MAG: hypothetical protein ACYDHW_08235 [Syntrophorhabdaceae bacterium]